MRTWETELEFIDAPKPYTGKYDFETFKGLVKQARDAHDYKKLEVLETMNPKMYDDAYGELSFADYCGYVEAQEDRKDWDFSRPIEL